VASKFCSRVLFYSSVRDPILFLRTGFYRGDVCALKGLGKTVVTTNRGRDALRFWRYDIFFAYFWKKALVPALVARCLGKRVIFTGGADELDHSCNPSTLSRLLHEAAFYLCHLVCHAALVQSQSDLRNMRRTVGPSAKLHYSPLPLAEFHIERSKRERKPRLVSIAWMSSEANAIRKGLDRAIRVLAEVRKRQPEFEMHILGTDGPGTTLLKRLARELGQDDAVKFLGAVSEEDKVRELLEAQFYIQLSRYEGFGLAVLEAMACGCVVVHSNRGGLMDTAGEAGVILSLELTDKEMAERLCNARGSPDSLKAIQDAAYLKVEQFSLNRRMREIDRALKISIMN
jgi:glycosyltransferase involved in cell wall biosynthesis